MSNQDQIRMFVFIELFECTDSYSNWPKQPFNNSYFGHPFINNTICAYGLISNLLFRRKFTSLSKKFLKYTKSIYEEKFR
jgi:hypothetical protein